MCCLQDDQLFDDDEIDVFEIEPTGSNLANVNFLLPNVFLGSPGLTLEDYKSTVDAHHSITNFPLQVSCASCPRFQIRRLLGRSIARKKKCSVFDTLKML